MAALPDQQPHKEPLTIMRTSKILASASALVAVLALSSSASATTEPDGGWASSAVSDAADFFDGDLGAIPGAGAVLDFDAESVATDGADGAAQGVGQP